MIEIKCNGEIRKISDGWPVAGLIEDLGLEPEYVVVELDGRILNRDEYERSTLHAGAVVELIRFVGGG